MTFKGRLENLDSEFNLRRISVWKNFVNGKGTYPSVIKEFLWEINLE